MRQDRGSSRQRGQNTVENMLLLAMVVAGVVIAGVSLKAFLPNLWDSVAATIGGTVASGHPPQADGGKLVQGTGGLVGGNGNESKCISWDGNNNCILQGFGGKQAVVDIVGITDTLGLLPVGMKE